jgi:hypothetical protein
MVFMMTMMTTVVVTLIDDDSGGGSDVTYVCMRAPASSNSCKSMVRTIDTLESKHT